MLTIIELSDCESVSMHRSRGMVSGATREFNDGRRPLDRCGRSVVSSWPCGRGGWKWKRLSDLFTVTDRGRSSVSPPITAVTSSQLHGSCAQNARLSSTQLDSRASTSWASWAGPGKFCPMWQHLKQGTVTSNSRSVPHPVRASRVRRRFAEFPWCAEVL